MRENIFTTNTEPRKKSAFSRGFKFSLGLGIFLTGVMSLPGMVCVIWGITEQIWKEMGVFRFVQNAMLYICILCCFICMITISKSKRMYSKAVVVCVRIIGWLITVSAFLLPRLPDYKSSGFEIVQYHTFTLIDGGKLMLGIIFLVFARIIKEGFSMQKELDEVL